MHTIRQSKYDKHDIQTIYTCMLSVHVGPTIFKCDSLHPASSCPASSEDTNQPVWPDDPEEALDTKPGNPLPIPHLHHNHFPCITAH